MPHPHILGSLNVALPKTSCAVQSKVLHYRRLFDPTRIQVYRTSCAVCELGTNRWSQKSIYYIGSLLAWHPASVAYLRAKRANGDHCLAYYWAFEKNVKPSTYRWRISLISSIGGRLAPSVDNAAFIRFWRSAGQQGQIGNQLMADSVLATCLNLA